MNTPLNVPIPLIERSGKGKMRRKTERRCEVGTLITGEGEGEGEGEGATCAAAIGEEERCWTLSLTMDPSNTLIDAKGMLKLDGSSSEMELELRRSGFGVTNGCLFLSFGLLPPHRRSVR